MKVLQIVIFLYLASIPRLLCTPISDQHPRLLKRQSVVEESPKEPLNKRVTLDPAHALAPLCKKPSHSGGKKQESQSKRDQKSEDSEGKGEGPECGDDDQTHRKPPTIKHPPWNLNDISCKPMEYLSPSEAWKAVDGDKALAIYELWFATNRLMCEPCMGQLVKACESKSPDCHDGLRDRAKTEGAENARWDTGIANFAQLTSTPDLQCDIGSNGCSKPPTCEECNGPGAYVLLRSLSTLHNTMQNQFDALKDAAGSAGRKIDQFTATFGR